MEKPLDKRKTFSVSVKQYTLAADVATPLTFAFVTDLHDCPNEPVLQILRTHKSDAILVGGDFVHSASHCERGMEFLREAAKLRPTFCTLGNHEKKCRRSAATLAADSGAVVLDNAAWLFRDIYIGGLSSGFPEKQSDLRPTPPPDAEWLEEFSRLDRYKLLICHHPEYYRQYIRPLPIDLTLSGHAHGGQWRIFGQGIFSPGQGLFPHYTSGIYGGRLIVSRGIGNAHRMIPRIGNPPEVIFITLI